MIPTRGGGVAVDISVETDSTRVVYYCIIGRGY